MNDKKKKIWSIVAGVLFVVAVLVTAGLLIKVNGLNMLPVKYLGLGILAIAVLLFVIFAVFFLVPANAKKIVKYVVRTLGILLTISLISVDIVGIQMVNKFEETMNNLVEDDDNSEVKIEEFIVGVYVLAEDKAESLEDVRRYNFAYSLAYDRNNTRRAISSLEATLERELKLEEYENVFKAVDAVLAGEKDAFILSSGYMDILEEQEGYEDISQKIKCVYECVVTSETQIVEKEERPFDVTKDPFVVYIGGHDVAFAATRANTDVNILAVVNPTTKQVVLISTPRDFYVPISVSEDGALDKLTHCGVYGVECSMETLAKFYGVDIPYYMQINFTGFIRMIDAIGGITVYSEKEFYSTNEGIYFKYGENEVNGEQALAFVRERMQFSGGDRARGEHQMQVIKGIIAKMSSGALLTNYNQILESMGGYFKCGMSQEDIASLVKIQLNDMAKWNVQSYSVTGLGELAPTYSLPGMNVYVMVPDEATVDHAKTLIDMVFSGETIEEEDLVVPVEEEE